MIDLLIFLITITTVLVIRAGNPVYAVLALIGVFLEAMIFMIYIGVEFLALLLITVYIGAIAILFLFVVMLLNLRTVGLYDSVQYRFSINAYIVLIISYIYSTLMLFFTKGGVYANWDLQESIVVDTLYYKTNIHSIGDLLYNHCAYYIVIIGLLLLVAMISVVILVIELSKIKDAFKGDDGVPSMIIGDRSALDLYVYDRYPDNYYSILKRLEQDNLSWRNMQIFAKDSTFRNKKMDINWKKYPDLPASYKYESLIIPLYTPGNPHFLPWNRWIYDEFVRMDQEILDELLDDKIDLLKQKLENKS